MWVASSSSVRKVRPGAARRRGLAFEHGTHLHRGGVGAQQQVGLGRVHEEGVLHFAGRVVRLEVQGVEVEPLGLDLGALGDLPAHADEDVPDAVLQQGQRMPGTGVSATAARDVHRLRDELRGRLGLEDLGLRAASAWSTRPRAPPMSLPARPSGPWARCGARRSAARGSTSPPCAGADGLELGESSAAAMAASAASTAACTACSVISRGSDTRHESSGRGAAVQAPGRRRRPAISSPGRAPPGPRRAPPSPGAPAWDPRVQACRRPSRRGGTGSLHDGRASGRTTTG